MKLCVGQTSNADINVCCAHCAKYEISTKSFPRIKLKSAIHNRLANIKRQSVPTFQNVHLA